MHKHFFNINSGCKKINTSKICQVFGKVRAHRCALVPSTLVEEVHTRDHAKQKSGFPIIVQKFHSPTAGHANRPPLPISHVSIPETLIFVIVNLIFSELNLQF